MTDNIETCPGCVGRGTGNGCCMCGRPIPEELRLQPGDPSELPGVAIPGWPFMVAQAAVGGVAR